MSSSASARERAIGSLEEREIFTLYRRRNGITQFDITAATGISQPMISGYEKGHVTFSPEKVARLWDAAEQVAAGRRQAEDVVGAA